MLLLQNNCCLSAFSLWGEPSLESKHNTSCCLYTITPPLLPQEIMAFFICSRKWLPSSTGKKGDLVPNTTLMGKGRRIGKHSHQHQQQGPPACTHPSTEAEPCALQAKQHPPALSGAMVTAEGLACVCLHTQSYAELGVQGKIALLPTAQ